MNWEFLSIKWQTGLIFSKLTISLLFNFSEKYSTNITKFMSVKWNKEFLKLENNNSEEKELRNFKTPLFLTSFKDLNFPWLEAKFPDFPWPWRIFSPDHFLTSGNHATSFRLFKEKKELNTSLPVAVVPGTLFSPSANSATNLPSSSNFAFSLSIFWNC